MSFSKTFPGSAAIVIAAVAAFSAEQRALDTSCDSPAGVIDGHQRQIDAAAKIVTAAAQAVPTDAAVQATIYGHANSDGTGTFGFSFSVSQLQTPAAAVAEASADQTGAATSG